jgi:hypothetical protein
MNKIIIWRRRKRGLCRFNLLSGKEHFRFVLSQNTLDARDKRLWFDKVLFLVYGLKENKPFYRNTIIIILFSFAIYICLAALIELRII